MRSVRVKICGVTRIEDLTVTVDSGADAIGFIVGVPSSPRNLTLEKAKMLLGHVPVFVDRVVVTAPTSPEWLIEVCERLKPTAIQIHGKTELDSSEIREKIRDTRLIKTVYVTEDAVKKMAIEDLRTFDAVLLDSFSNRQYGGTGKTHDWELSRQIRKFIAPVPVILAGGLNPENVKEAILAVRPYAVDVASGVEASHGIKDHYKVRAFVENAKHIKLHNKGVIE